jgi:hypothetical protein
VVRHLPFVGLALALACGGLIEGEASAPGDAAAREDARDAGEPTQSFGGADASFVDPGVPCGKDDNLPKSCNVKANKVCCMPYRDSVGHAFDWVGNRCSARGECAAGEVAAECNGPRDCADGAVCCVRFVEGGFPSTVKSITCSALADCARERHLLLCESSVAGTCPEGGGCREIWAVPHIEACQ